MFISKSYYTKPVNKITKFIFFVVLTLNANLSFSQLIGKGELLEPQSIERITKSNKLNGLDYYNSIYSSFNIKLDLSEAKVDPELILKVVKSIPGIIECTYDENSGVLIALAKKLKDNSYESQLKQQIDRKGYVLVSIKELLYKI